MKIDYKLYLSIILAIIVCFILFLGYAHWTPNLPNDKDVLGNWITMLIFLVTVSAGVMPLVINDRQDKFKKETEEKISKIENHYKEQNEKIKKNEEALNNSIFLMRNCYNAIGEFYLQKLDTQIDQFINQHKEADAKKITHLLNNILLSIYMSKDTVFAIQAMTDAKKLLNDIQSDNDKDLLQEVLYNSLVLHKFTYNENWQIFFGEDKEKYQEFQTIFCEIYGVNYDEIFISQ